jgi:hypothetical protein
MGLLESYVKIERGERREKESDCKWEGRHPQPDHKKRERKKAWALRGERAGGVQEGLESGRSSDRKATPLTTSLTIIISNSMNELP